MTASEELLTVRATRFDDWRNTARRLLVSGVAPEAIHWIDGRSRTGRRQETLFGPVDDPTPSADHVPSTASTFHVPNTYVSLARRVACHRDPQRWELLYRVLWRLTGGEKHLLQDASDRDVVRLSAMEKSIRRDAHKTKAFVRFRETQDEQGPRFIAWHRPDHYILEITADFFARRFDVMRWAILTPDESVGWDGNSLQFGEGVPRSEAPKEDEWETLWKTYYANIFNPARIKLNAMRAEMPKKHWPTMPETALIDDLVRDAGKRVDTMRSHVEGSVTAKSYLPTAGAPSLDQLRDAAKRCEACELHEAATATVFGTGPPHASLVLVGEQPGDQEDLVGLPFVGPAGRLLDEILAEVGLDRNEIYVTNAVKHFHHRDTGKQRLHLKPSARHTAACRPWLDAELATIRPKMVVGLGATAASVLLGPAFRITKQRGEVHTTDYARWTMATYHPSAILRSANADAQQKMRQLLTEDLRNAADHLRMLQGGDA
ncbi:MAG: UdgX family uracil-DNA binding protein [Planctomycetota bacterium]